MSESDFWWTLLMFAFFGFLAGCLLGLVAKGLEALIIWLATGTVGMVILGAAATELGEPLFWGSSVAAAMGLMLGYSLVED